MNTELFLINSITESMFQYCIVTSLVLTFLKSDNVITYSNMKINLNNKLIKNKQ